MFLRPFAAGIVLLFAAGLSAQTQSTSTASAPADQAVQTDHPTPLRTAQRIL